MCQSLCLGSRLTTEHQAQAAALRLTQVAPGTRGPRAPQEPAVRCWCALQEAPCVSLGGTLWDGEMACFAKHASYSTSSAVQGALMPEAHDNHMAQIKTK